MLYCVSHRALCELTPVRVVTKETHSEHVSCCALPVCLWSLVSFLLLGDTAGTQVKMPLPDADGPLPTLRET